MGFKENHDQAVLAGQRGAATVKERLGVDHFARMGKRGGAVTKEKYGVEHYRAAGRKGGATRWARVRARQAEEG